MKLDFLKIKKNYKKESFETNVNNYWKGILFFALIFLIGSFIFSYNLFLEINKNDGSNLIENRDKIGSKEKEKIKGVLEYFSEREKRSNDILENTLQIVDPSL